MMATKLFTVADLAERWGVSADEVLRQVEKNKVPFLEFSGRGGKLLRFKPSAIEQWEQSRQRHEGQEAEQLPAAGVAPGWDGHSRLTQGRQRKGRASG